MTLFSMFNYFDNVLAAFLGLERGRCIAAHAESESSRISLQNFLNCVQKMNESLTGLERHEGE